MTTTEQELATRIEAVVQEYIRAGRMAGKAAVERAFSAVIVESRKRPNVAEHAAADRTRSRTPEEMAILGEQFYQAVCANPGETMITLGGHVSATAQSLRSVVKRLKRERRIRSAGQRQETRYFPMAEGLGVGEPPTIG